MTKKINTVSKIDLSRFIIGRRIRKLSKNGEGNLKIKAAYFEWFSLAMCHSTGVSYTM
jgi:hypothetical protein